MIFENRSGAGVDFFKEGTESFCEYEVSLLITDFCYCRLFFYKACYNKTFKGAILLHRKS